jgi:TolB-like protein/Tfp pilus assembly protein PilF
MAVELGLSKTPMQSLATAKELVEKAIAINPSLPGPYGVLSHVYRSMGQYDKSIEEAKKAISLNSNSVLGNGAMGAILLYVGRSEESILYLEKAIRVDPFSTIYFGTLGWSYFLSGQPEEAIQVCKRAADSRPHDFGAQLCLASAYATAGYEEKAQVAGSNILKMNPKFSLNWLSKLVGRRYKKQADKELIISSLRKAGLPEHPPLQLPDKPSIAVLAFDNLSGDPEQEYFSDGIAENIITALSKVGELFVIARNSSFTYKGKPVKVQQVSRELGVRYVLEGSVQKSGDRVRITAQLIDAKNGQHLWAENYDRDFKDIFEIQDEMTKKIVTALRIELTEGEQARMFERQSKNLDVFLKFTQGLSHWQDGTKEGLIRFGQLGQEIVDIDPDSSIGYRMLGWYHWGLALRGKSPRESMKKSFKFAQKALSRDESDALSHFLLGNVYLLMRKYEKAIESGKRSVELAPNGAIVHAGLGYIFSHVEQLDDAIAHLKQAIRLNPFPPYWYYLNLGRCYRQKGQYEDALTEFKKGLQRSPDGYLNYLNLATAYVFLERQEEAEAAAKKVIEKYPKFSIARSSKAWPYKNPTDLKILVDALRKAGLPE